MSRLINANLSRMIKSKIFWVAEIFLIGYSFFIYVMSLDSIRYRGMANVGWNLYFFNEMLFLGVVIAIFAVFFVGVEYSDGTIRNKIVVGHTRRDIYLANFVVCFVAGVIQFATYCIASVIAGMLLIGNITLTQLHQLPWRIVYSLFIILTYAAIFSMLTMLDDNRVRATVIGFLAVLVFLLLVTWIYGDLQQPERTNRMTYSAAGELQLEEDIPNSKYITGGKRVVYEWIDTFLPANQAMYVIDDSYDSFSAKAPLCLLGESVIFVCAGMYCFRRKDIK